MLKGMALLDPDLCWAAVAFEQQTPYGLHRGKASYARIDDTAIPTIYHREELNTDGVPIDTLDVVFDHFKAVHSQQDEYRLEAFGLTQPGGKTTTKDAPPATMAVKPVDAHADHSASEIDVAVDNRSDMLVRNLFLGIGVCCVVLGVAADVLFATRKKE